MNALAIAAVAACMGWSVQSFGYAAMPLEFGGGSSLVGLFQLLAASTEGRRDLFLAELNELSAIACTAQLSDDLPSARLKLLCAKLE